MKVTPAAMVETIEKLGFKARVLDRATALAPAASSGAASVRSARIEALLQQARRESKPLVLEFSGAFCSACRRLEKETLRDPRVRAALGKVLFHKVDVEKDREAAFQFGIHAIPQLRFLTPDGKIAARAQGVISVEEMLDRLAKIGAD